MSHNAGFILIAVIKWLHVPPRYKSNRETRSIVTWSCSSRTNSSSMAITRYLAANTRLGLFLRIPEIANAQCTK
jgi:hypothetical protein